MKILKNTYLSLLLIVISNSYSQTGIYLSDGILSIEMPTNIDILNGYPSADDLNSDGITGIPCLASVKSKDGVDMSNPLRPILADKYVRFVGDYVAFVIAETKSQAKAAIELIEVDYEVLLFQFLFGHAKQHLSLIKAHQIKIL